MRHPALIGFLLLAACGRPEATTLNGYVEAELLYLSPQDAGVVSALSVREGDRVAAGDTLFTLDPARLSIAAEQAAAAAESAEARAADDGAMAQQIAEAQAALLLAEQTFARSRDLVRDGAVPREKYDADAAALTMATAQLDRARAERAAMQGEWTSMSAAARLADRRLADLSTTAPAAGSIERIYRRPGEVVAAGEPVVALLPPENLKLRFFAPETLLARMQIGAPLTFSCDACAAGHTARISFIASEPQFTPPVIYSIGEREKLVYLIEARPDDASGLRPGLPVTIEPPR